MIRNKKIGLLLVLVLLAAVAYGGVKFVGPSYSLTMDVNPSIEIVSNRFDKVVEVKPLNEDAREMLKDFEIKDKDLTSTIEDLADLMVLTGYISGGEDNLVSIRVSDGNASEEVLNRLNQAIAAYLENKQIEATIVNEPIQADPVVATTNEENVVKNNDDDVDSTRTVQKPVQKAESNTRAKSSKLTLIGEARAKEIALGKTGGGTIVEFELDWDDGRPEYEIEIKANGYEYELEIDGYTGKVLEFEKDDDDDYRSSSKPASKPAPKSTTKPSKPSLIGDARAKEIALAKSGGGKVVEFELDWDDGRPEYEIEIKKDGLEYEVEIDGYTGQILEFEIDD